MKSILRRALWAAVALPVAGIVAVGVLRAQQPPVAGQQPAQPPSAGQSVLSPVPAPPRGAVYLPANNDALKRGQTLQLVVSEDGKRQIPIVVSDEAYRLAAEYAATEDGEKRAAIKAELLKVLSEQFETQQQIRERELADVEARVKKLRELTQKRRDAQKTIVDQRLDQLLREAEGLGWTPPANAYDAVVPPQATSATSKSDSKTFIKVTEGVAPRR